MRRAFRVTTVLAGVLCASVAAAYEPDCRSHDALAEVNAVRAARGLPPYRRDAELTIAARLAARYRADYLIAGHTRNDFYFVPAGYHASAAGCAAWQRGDGWGSCCTYERWTYAGAAWCYGRDGRRYMHLFVR